jgi:hypothetical protein
VSYDFIAYHGTFSLFSRAMAQKESQHREAIEVLNEELRQLRRQHDELTALSSNQVHLIHTDGMDGNTDLFM